MSSRGATAAGNLALIGAWLWLFSPTLGWLGRTFAATQHRLNLALLAVAAAALLWRLGRACPPRRWLAAIAQPPSLRPLPLALAIGALASYLAVERFLDLDLLSALLFGLGSHALLGLYLPPAAWRRALPTSLLLVALLPLGDAADFYLGSSLRVATARLVSGGLGALGLAALPAETILVLENGLAHIDVPCSGLRGLWTGGLFLLAWTVLERAPIDRRWLRLAALLGLLLLGANLARVTVVVLVGGALARPLLAEILHVPLGVLGHAAACGLIAWRLRHAAPAPAVEPPPPAARPLPAWPLAALVAVAALGYAPRPLPAPSRADLSPPFPTELSPARVDLSPAERDLFGRFGDQASKWRLSWRDAQVSALVVHSRSWRAFHPPEVCLASVGFHVDSFRDLARGPGRAARRLSLDHGRRTAVYWYQSPRRSTSSLLEMIWADSFARERLWAEVSVLLDRPIDDAAAADLAAELQGVIARTLDAPPEDNAPPIVARATLEE